jgi:O-antigen ligase
MAVVVAWLAFLASAGVTTVLNYSSQALSRYGSLLVEGLVLWLVVWCVIRDGRGSHALHLTIVVTTCFVAGSTLVLAALGMGYSDVLGRLAGLAVQPSTDIRFGLLRQEGSFPAPLFFATWLAGASMLILPWLEEERFLRRILAWAGWVILLLAAVLTVSRVGIVVALTGTGVYFLLRMRTRLGMVMFAFALIAALIMAGFTFPSFLSSNSNSPGSVGPSSVSSTQVAAQQAALTGSASLRIEALKAAWPVLLKKPLFGYGLLSAGPVLSAAIGRPNYIDDTYVQYLVELGVLGFAAFALLVLATLGRAVRLPWSPVHISRMLALVVLLGMAALASFLSITQGHAAFVLLLALVVIGAPAAHADTRSA